MANRQILHGSFANTGFEPRVSANFGFNKRASVLDVLGAGIHADAAVFDAEFIAQRSRAIGLAIEARAAHFPDEMPYAYAPQAGQRFVWDAAGRASLKDYNAMDLSI